MFSTSPIQVARSKRDAALLKAKVDLSETITYIDRTIDKNKEAIEGIEREMFHLRGLILSKQQEIALLNWEKENISTAQNALETE
jgi:hypothetical protein